MADFCRQCSIDTFGEDYRDMAGISKPEDTAQELYAQVICEGCGVTSVDHEGVCVSPACMEKHGVKQPVNPLFIG
ncbi:hypothetical protein RWE87_13735 [Sinorhizobium meliloti]|uniref:hypothetical protein n=1 Tax=Rhizobium meliloti TaxID=382 RepID=UPI00299DBBE8|nr:hypothetical protein [Sinorhizobium meliloti]